MTQNGVQRMCTPEMARAMTSLLISEERSKIVKTVTFTAFHLVSGLGFQNQVLRGYE
jgi:hypothetical protein